MESAGIIKEFDKLGRLVIPKEMRDRFSLDGRVELVVSEEGILLRSLVYTLTRRTR